MIDLDALKARLAEYDDARHRCQGKVARNINCATDHLPSDDPTYHEYIITTYSPCCRPEGHEGDCRNSRSVMGWPGFVTVSALVAEVERLRGECGQAYLQGVKAGRDAERISERGAVVAWLRNKGRDPLTFMSEAIALTCAASVIERGEHRREEEK